MEPKMSDHIQALIDEVPGIAAGDKVSVYSIMKAQEQHRANLAAVAELKSALEGRAAEVEELKAKLASGQCVDLAKVGEQGFADIIQGESQPNEEALTEARDILRILIEKAGVKL